MENRTAYKVALKSGFYDFGGARDTYRLYTASSGIGMHHDCVYRFAELQAQMLCVIAPHWAEYIWREVLNKVRSLRCPDPI
jgi:leucyl-tRNA synthetase